MTFFRPLFAPLVVHDPFHHPLLEDPWTTRYNHSVQRAEGDGHRRSKHHHHHQTQQGATTGSTEGAGGAQQQVPTHSLDWPSTPQDLFTHPAFTSPFTFPTFEQFFAPFQTIQHAQPHPQGQGQIQSQAQGQVQGQGQSNLATSSGTTTDNVVATSNPLGGGILNPFSPSFPSALTSTPPWPRLDVHETPEKFTLTAELGGVPKEKVQVHVDELRGVLEVRGEVYRSTGTNEGEGETHVVDKDAAHAKKTSGGGGEEGKEGDKANKQKKSSSSSSARPVYTERVYGSFSRSLRLPSSVDLRGIKADFDQEGILKVDLPKKKSGEEGREGVREIQIGKEK